MRNNVRFRMVAIFAILITGLIGCKSDLPALTLPVITPSPQITPFVAIIPIQTPAPSPQTTSRPTTTSTPKPEPNPAPTPAPEPNLDFTSVPSLTPNPTSSLKPAWREVNPPFGANVPNAQWIEVEAPLGKKILASVFRPQGTGPFPIVVFLHGTEGFRVIHTQLAEDIAKDGFITVAGDWFGGHYAVTPSAPGGVIPQIPPPTDAITYPNSPQIPMMGPNIFTAVDNVIALIDAVRTLPQARADRIGLFGHSRGSAAATAVALTGVNLQAVVAVAGYAPTTDTPNASVERVRSPLLILQGTQDRFQAIREAAKPFENALREQGKTVEAYYYEGAPHRIPYILPWSTDVRQRAIAFFRKYLSD